MSLDAPNPITTDPKGFLTELIQNRRFRSGDFTLDDIRIAFLCLDQVIVDYSYRGSAAQAALLLAVKYPEIAQPFKKLLKKAKECYPVKEDVAYLDTRWVRWFMFRDESAVEDVLRIVQWTKDENMAQKAIWTIQQSSVQDPELGKFLSKKFGKQAV